MARPTIEDFRKTLMHEARLSASLSGIGNTLPFIEYIISELQGTNFVDDPKTFYWSGKGASNSEILLFGYDYDEADNTISIYTGLFGETDEIATITRSQIDDKAKRAFRFAKESLTDKESQFIKSLENDAADFKELLQELDRSPTGILKIKAVFITNDRLSSRVKRIESNEVIKDIPTEIQIWDIERLYNLLIISTEGNEELEIDLLAIEDIGVPLPFLEVPQDVENHFSCYLSVIPGEILAHIYAEHGSQLLEGNVRSFLSSKTAVNKKIQATINTEPSKFFVYNNGISATATEVEVENGCITKLKNFQIINGGQTTASLAYAKKKRNVDISKISVPMKLTIVKEANPVEMASTIQKISRSSNSQNKVSDADFFANHEFHILMEKISMRTQAPPEKSHTYGTYWFYERAKGQYTQKKMFLTKSGIEKFEEEYPKGKLLSKTDFAKYHNIWKGFPQVVSRGAITNFNHFANTIEEDWEKHYKKANYNDFYFKQICCIASLYRNLEKEITVTKLDWYKGSYRANVIAYTLSLFFKLLSQNLTNKVFNFPKLWNEQEPGEDLIQVLLKLSKAVYFELINPNRDIENVTQWCKREACWKNIQDTFYNYQIDIESISPYIVSSERVVSAKIEAKKSQKLDNEINLLSQVVATEKVERWKHLPLYVEQHKSEISPTMNELQAVDAVIKMCAGKGNNVSDKMCLLALSIWDKATDNGWK